MKVAPPLHDCPDCGLALQRGKGKHALAWHDCAEVQRLRESAVGSSLTLEEATSKALQTALDKMAGANPRDAAAILASIGSLHGRKGAGGAGGEPSAKARQFALRKD